MMERFENLKNVAVIGGGSWGTALAMQIAKALGKCKIYLRDQKVLHEINEKNANPKYLGQLVLPSTVYASNSYAKLHSHQVIIIATPARSFPEIMELMRGVAVSESAVIMIATKGIEGQFIQLHSEIVAHYFPKNEVAILSGPTFALEVAKGKFTAVDIACRNYELAEQLAHNFSTSNFLAKPTKDIITVQLAGAMKNIMAIMGGVFLGLNMGENARSYLYTQSLKEIMALSTKMGGDLESFSLFSVSGDLNLTFNSLTSRNTKFGYDLAKSDDPHKFIAGCQYLAEGVSAAGAINRLAKQNGLRLPIVSAVDDLIKCTKSVEEIITQLMNFTDELAS